VPDAGPNRPLPSEAAPAATEIVTRPDPGLARGKWEAKPLFIEIFGGALVLAFIAFLLVKGRRKKKRATKPR
jgi:hypothetical protein